MLPPINLRQWLALNRHLLQPPVNNKVVWEDSEFIVMLVGGRNQRMDYHVNVGEEFFYQIEGDMELKIVEQGQFKNVSIRQGEIFLLPGSVPHSPQRLENTVGMVIEKKRQPCERDGFQWYCQNCETLLHEVYVHVSDIVKDLPPVLDGFYSNAERSTCRVCGLVASK